MANPAPVVLDTGNLDPRVVDAVTGGPDDCVVLRRLAVGEGDGATAGAGDPRPLADTAAAQLAQAAADDDVSLGEPPAQPRGGRDPRHPQGCQPPPQIAAQGTLRQGRELLSDRDLDLVRRRQLERE